MGQANKVKKEYVDVVEMVSLVQTLKDIADNKFYTLTAKKDKFRRFGETFIEFFRLISQVEVDHPLVKNDNPVTGIIVVTAEGSFLGEFNNKIFRLAMKQKEKYEQVKFIGIGEKTIERLGKETPDLKTFLNAESVGLYETAVAVKDYVVDEVMNNRMGQVVICYSWPKSFDTHKPRSLKLLPCTELIEKQKEMADELKKVIEESDPVDMIVYLSNLWITTKIFEILNDTMTAGAAAQSQFLEDSLEKMKKERKKTQMKYRKAKKSDIDKSLRETFSARMMTVK